MGPIVHVDRSEIMPGRFEELTSRIAELAALVEAGERQIGGYSVYVNGDRTEISVVHIHRDADSLALHFQVAGPAFSRFVDLVRLKSIDVYGDPTDDLVEQLRQKARLLGGATVTIHPYLTGFARISGSMASAPAAPEIAT